MSPENEKDINISTGNDVLINDVMKILQIKINQIDDGDYKENVKLLIEILNKDISRINYIHIKSLYIIYNLINKLKRIQTVDENSINLLINDLSNSLLEDGFNIDTDLENMIINDFKNNKYYIEEKYIIMYKDKIKEILTSILVKESDNEVYIVNVKEFLENKIDENIKILINGLLTNSTYIARK